MDNAMEILTFFIKCIVAIPYILRILIFVVVLIVAIVAIYTKRRNRIERKKKAQQERDAIRWNKAKLLAALRRLHTTVSSIVQEDVDFKICLSHDLRVRWSEQAQGVLELLGDFEGRGAWMLERACHDACPLVAAIMLGMMPWDEDCDVDGVDKGVRRVLKERTHALAVSWGYTLVRHQR